MDPALSGDDVIIGRIGELHIDKNQNFYVSDLISQTIKKFDKKGMFQQEIGRRGRGNGEFMSIKGFSMGYAPDDTELLIVSDEVNRIINVYTIRGELVTSYGIPTGTEFPRGKFKSIILNNEIKHLFWYKLHEASPDQNCLFHLFNHDFTSKEQCYGDFHDLRTHKNKTFHYLTQAQAGHVVIDEDNTIYYTPKFYEGVIYQYSFNSFDQSWFLSGFLEGLVHHTNPIKENKEPSNYQVSYSGERLYGRLLNVSLGLFNTPSGLVHFTRITTPEDEIWFGMESFNQDGRLQAYYKISIVPPEEDDRWNDVLNIDGQGYYYVADNHTEIPILYQMRF
ncbi:MAG: 6-bladed beta-propeller [Balneolaceae bacterium]